jgi:RNA polymerase sigma-70 factor (ECF subfamily)
MFSIETKRELQKGNPEAFKEVFRLLYPRLKGYCKLFVPNESEVEDLIQECFITLWENRNSIDIKKRLESFLFVIIRNKCLNFLKSQRLESGNISPENLQVAQLQYMYQLDLAEKEEKSLEELLIQSFQETVDTLPEKMKVVFVKCKLEGKKQTEVAAELGISIKMVEKQILKAKKQIREQLLKKYPALALVIAMLLG